MRCCCCCLNQAPLSIYAIAIFLVSLASCDCRDRARKLDKRNRLHLLISLHFVMIASQRDLTAAYAQNLKKLSFLLGEKQISNHPVATRFRKMYNLKTVTLDFDITQKNFVYDFLYGLYRVLLLYCSFVKEQNSRSIWKVILAPPCRTRRNAQM